MTDCDVANLSSETERAEATNARKERIPLLKIINSVIQGCNFLLFEYQSKNERSFKIDFWKVVVSSNFNELFINMAVWFMQKAKDFVLWIWCFRL